MAKTLLQRFEEKYETEPNTGCWLWTACYSTSGYGQILDKSGQTKSWHKRAAHRVSYELFVGSIPEGLDLDHLCRTRGCVNPAHLEPVTRTENIRRGICSEVQKQRHKMRTHCPHGHEYTPENTYLTKPYRGYRNRMCKNCARIRMAVRREKKHCSIS